MNIIKDFELRDITTLHIPAKCKYFCEYDNIDELKTIIKSHIGKTSLLHIGGGSNLVFTKDFDGAILHSNIKYIEKIEETNDTVILKVGSGYKWDCFVKYCVDNNYYGAENMSYIPGEVGASAIQNIGSYGVEVKDIIHKVHTLEISTLTQKEFTTEECKYGYRDSIFKNNLKDKYVVLAVEYKMSKIPHYNLTYGPLHNLDSNNLNLEIIRNEIIRIRTAKLPDPKYIGSVGSFFKNPIIPISDFNVLKLEYPNIPSYNISDELIKVPAGWLIENSGLKGYKVGDAQVYEKQCLVLVNNGNAVAGEIINLYTDVINFVKSKFGIELSPEANII